MSAADNMLKIMLFSILLNVATGIMIQSIPVFTDYPEYRGGMIYNEEYASDFTKQLNTSVNAQSDLEDRTSIVQMILDKVRLGWIKKLLNTIKIDIYMFGFINMLDQLLGSGLDTGMRVFLFGSFKTIISIGYVIGAIMLWMGVTPET